MRFGGGTNEVLRDVIAQRGHGMPSLRAVIGMRADSRSGRSAIWPRCAAACLPPSARRRLPAHAGGERTAADAVEGARRRGRARAGDRGAPRRLRRRLDRPRGLLLWRPDVRCAPWLFTAPCRRRSPSTGSAARRCGQLGCRSWRPEPCAEQSRCAIRATRPSSARCCAPVPDGTSWRLQRRRGLRRRRRPRRLDRRHGRRATGARSAFVVDTGSHRHQSSNRWR